MEKDIEYVQAELWSEEFAEAGQNQNDITSQRNGNNYQIMRLRKVRDRAPRMQESKVTR